MGQEDGESTGKVHNGAPAEVKEKPWQSAEEGASAAQGRVQA